MLVVIQKLEVQTIVSLVERLDVVSQDVVARVVFAKKTMILFVRNRLKCQRWIYYTHFDYNFFIYKLFSLSNIDSLVALEMEELVAVS